MQINWDDQYPIYSSLGLVTHTRQDTGQLAIRFDDFNFGITATSLSLEGRSPKNLVDLGIIRAVCDVTIAGTLAPQEVYFLKIKNLPLGTHYFYVPPGYIPVNAKLATTTNISLSGFQVIDGVLTVNNDIVIVKNQTDETENDIYLAKTGAWTKYTASYQNYYATPFLLSVTSGVGNGGKTYLVSRITFIVSYSPTYHFEFNSITIILYSSYDDAVDEINPIIPPENTQFSLNFFNKIYTPIACVEMAAANVADIYCCPAPTEYLQTFPDHVEIVLEAGSLGSGTPGATFLLTMFYDGGTGTLLTPGYSNQISTYDGAEFTTAGAFGGRFWHTDYSYPVCSGTPKKTPTNFFQWARDYGQYSITRYQTSSYADLCAAYPASFWQGWKYAAADYQALPQGYEMTGSSISNRVATHVPRILSVELKSAQTIPPTISCYLVDAVFQRTTVDIPSGDDIALGTIDVTLTYDAVSSTYYGPVANYYNIPGRLSMPIGILPTVASGSQFLVNGINWKVNSSNQIYYEKYLSSGAMDNTITLFYSSYSDARKPTPSTLNFYKTNSYSVYTETNGSLLRSDPTTQTATP